MKLKLYSPTEGVLIIEFPGRGVSLLRTGKSRHFKRTKHQGQFAVTNKPTTCNVPNENRDIESTVMPCHQIVRFNEDIAVRWANTPLNPGEKSLVRRLEITAKETPMMRFSFRVYLHFSELCRSAQIHEHRCHYKFDVAK